MTSCATSRRLKRIYNEDRSQAKEADRANAFPLFYANGDSKSLLWPLMDSDKQGFSIRPFFNKEGNEYAVLFPLTAWNPVKGDGWVGPLYWDKKRSVLFPLYYRDKDHLQVLTYYQSSDCAIMFPFYYKNKDSMQVLTYFSGEEYSCLFPFYYKENTDSGQEGFYTLLGGYSKNGDKSNYMVTPLWWSGSSPRTDYKVLFPLFMSFKKRTKEGKLYADQWCFPMLCPLASKEKTDTGTRTSSLGGFLFDHEEIGEMKQGDVLFCMADWKSDLNSSRFRFPAIFTLPGLVDISHKDETSKANYFYLYSVEKKPNSVKRDIFPGITWDSGENESGFSFLWRVFEKHDRNGKKGGHIFFIPYGA